MSDEVDFINEENVIVEQEGVDFHIPPEEMVDPDEVRISDKDSFIKSLQNILRGMKPEDDGTSIINVVNRNRSLVLDIAMEAYIRKPGNAKLLDSINTIMGQLEKSIRDDRKEQSKKEELQDNKANFALFMGALTEISSGRLELPTFKEFSMGFDPLGETNIEHDDILEDELSMGNILVDSKEIEESLEE